MQFLLEETFTKSLIMWIYMLYFCQKLILLFNMLR